MLNFNLIGGENKESPHSIASGRCFQMKKLIYLLTFVLVVVVSITSFARDSWCSGRVINAETMRRVYGSKITIIDAQSNEILGKGTDNPPEHDISIWGGCLF